MLEIFCGSKNMTHVAAKLGFETLTLDSDPKVAPDILTDILDWDYKDKRWGTFDYIHCSIPCEEWSRCHTRSERNLPLARQIAERTRAIIEHFRRNSRCIFTVEQPASSLLCREEAVQGWLWTDASYCCYGFPYQKHTRFWHNLPSLSLRKCCPEHCFWRMKGHPMSVQHAPPEMRAVIPACLCFEILTTVCAAMGASIAARIPLKPLRAPRPRAATQPSQESKRGRPKRDTQDVSCSVCGNEEAVQFYNLTRGPTMCSRCYRRTRRHAKEAAQKERTRAHVDTSVPADSGTEGL